MAVTDGIRNLIMEKYLRKCNRCGSSRNLQIHHRDEKPNNNDIKNLELLCIKCHSKEHTGVSLRGNIPATTLFILDRKVWNWAQYEAKDLGHESTSHLIFEMLKERKEKNK